MSATPARVQPGFLTALRKDCFFWSLLAVLAVLTALDARAVVDYPALVDWPTARVLGQQDRRRHVADELRTQGAEQKERAGLFEIELAHRVLQQRRARQQAQIAIGA